jgi:signal transduction histidine kinase
MRFSLTIQCLLAGTTLLAQEIPTIKLSHWRSLQVVDPYVSMYVDSSHQTFESVANQTFSVPPQNYLNELVSYPQNKSPHYFRIRVVNDLPDTANFFFMISPQKEAEVAAIASDNKIEKLVPRWRHQRHTNTVKTHSFQLHPLEQKDFIIKIVFPKNARASIYMYLEDERDFSEFMIFWTGSLNNEFTFMWLFCGMLLMMFIYITLKFIQIQSREYFYYGAYILFFMLYFFMRAAGGSGIESIYYNEWFSGIANDQLQAGAYIMYYFFVKHFLHTKINFRRLHQVLNVSTVFILTYMAIDFTLFWFPDLIQLKHRIWDVVRLVLFGVTIYSIVQIAKQKSPLGVYIVWGGLLLGTFALMAMFFSFSQNFIVHLPSPFDSPLTYFQLGIAAELICFSLGLGYKNKLVEVEKIRVEQDMKIAAERQHFERYRAISETREAERSRIAKDLHDGVGGMLTGVRISLSNIQSKLPLDKHDELTFARSMDMLDGSVHELRRVAHALQPPSLEAFGLKAALHDYIESINNMKSVKTILQTIGEERRFEKEQELIIYRIVQELINNVLKHAQAAQCLVQVAYLSGHLSITVEDNGKGFDTNQAMKGMGWINIRQRVDFLKGSVDVNSSARDGTSVQIDIPFESDMSTGN